uniref:Uncharacterized protein n=1 Tax=Brassica oleracea TaxID=3712 RepID=A0A3P6EZ22_BRAOL|nr:unnamed protein product [Brassica oleracea]
MDLGRLLLTLVDVDGRGWMDPGMHSLWGQRNFPRRESALHSEVEAPRWAMENMLQHSTAELRDRL